MTTSPAPAATSSAAPPATVAGAPAAPSSPSSTGIAVRYVTLALIWGSSFLLIKLALDGLTPVQVAGGRIVLGALALVTVATLARRPWPRSPRVWGHLAVTGLVLCVLPFLAFAWAGQHLASGLSSILNATTPLMTAAASAALLPTERLTRRQSVGLALGILGVVVIVGPWTYVSDLAEAAPLPAVLACLGATTCYGIGMTYLRRFVTPLRLAPETVAAGQVGSAAVVMLALAPFAARTPVTLSAGVVAGIVLLGVLGTGIAYVWNTQVVGAWGAQRASTVTYLTPVVGVALGMTVLGERLEWYEPLGGAIVVVGVVVAQGLSLRVRRASQEADLEPVRP